MMAKFTWLIPASWVNPMDNKWEITDNYEKAIPFSDVVLITVPTPVNDDNSPNLDYVHSAVSSVLDNVKSESGTIIVLESTVYPGVKGMFSRCCEERQISMFSHNRKSRSWPKWSRSKFCAQIVGCDFRKLGIF